MLRRARRHNPLWRMTIRAITATALLLGLGSAAVADEPPARLKRDHEKLIMQMTEIIRNQREISDRIAYGIRRPYLNTSRTPRLESPADVTLRPGEKTTVAVKIDWRTFKDTKLGVKLATLPSEADIGIPEEIALDEEKQHATQFDIEVRAGKTLGVFTVKAFPEYGEAVEFRVVVR